MAEFVHLAGRGYHRAIWFYENGLIPVLPTREQFRVGCSARRLAQIVRRRGRPLLRQLTSIQAFRSVGRTDADATARTLESTKNSENRLSPGAQQKTLTRSASDPSRFDGLSAIDRALARATEIDLLRGILTHTVVPCASIAGTGFQIGAGQVANHLLCAPHPCEQAVWDLQLIQGDPDGLETLERRIEEARAATTLRGKILHTVGTLRVERAHRFELVRTTNSAGEVRYTDAALVDEGEVVVDSDGWSKWYDHTLDVVAMARKFQYLDRDIDNPSYQAPTVPAFLERCAELEPGDYAFFRDRGIMGDYPEIDWPREATG